MRPVMRRILAAGVIAVLVLGAAGAYKVLHKDKPPEKRGSARVEFDAGARPDQTKQKAKVAWPTFGYDQQRTKDVPFKLGPPFRRTWRVDGRDTLEFPPSVAYGNLYQAQQKGLFIALRGKTGKKVLQDEALPALCGLVADHRQGRDLPVLHGLRALPAGRLAPHGLRGGHERQDRAPEVALQGPAVRVLAAAAPRDPVRGLLGRQGATPSGQRPATRSGATTPAAA